MRFSGNPGARATFSRLSTFAITGDRRLSDAVLNPISTLHKVAVFEGVSFLVLLFVAMPAKYFLGAPMAVKVVGWAHGALFVLFCLALLWAMLAARWSITRAAMVFTGGLIPFGPFLLHGRMREYATEYAARKSGN